MKLRTMSSEFACDVVSRLRWCTLRDDDSDASYGAALRHLASQPLLEAGLFVAIKVRHIKVLL